MSDPSVPWLAAGFAAGWILLGGYIVSLWLRHRDVSQRLNEAERGGGSAGAPTG